MDEMFCCAVTTYKKNIALRVFLDSLWTSFNHDTLGHVVICDDNYPEAEPVYEEFKELFQGRLVYIGGDRRGIAKNKNRGIWYFLEKTKDSYLLLCDDDIQLTNKGLEQLLLGAKWPHILGFLEDYTDPGSAESFFNKFPKAHETEDLSFHYGSQGILMFYTRSVVESVGYMNTNLKGYYGFEHDLYSQRINKKMGFFPQYYALLKWSPHMFLTQYVVNNHSETAIANKTQYGKIFQDILAGINLKVREPEIGKVVLHESERRVGFTSKIDS